MGHIVITSLSSVCHTFYVGSIIDAGRHLLHSLRNMFSNCCNFVHLDLLLPYFTFIYIHVYIYWPLTWYNFTPVSPWPWKSMWFCLGRWHYCIKKAKQIKWQKWVFNAGCQLYKMPLGAFCITAILHWVSSCCQCLEILKILSASFLRFHCKLAKS